MIKHKLLKEKRSEKDISQKELALRALTSQRYISDLETGKQEVPCLKILNRICEVLELNLAELF